MCVLAGAAHARSQVLIIFDEDKEFPGLAVINHNLQQSLREELQSPVEFYSESLNLSRFDRPGYEPVLREYFQRKYQGQRVDLIVAVMEPALDFLLRNRDTLFLVSRSCSAAPIRRMSRRYRSRGTLRVCS